MEAIITAATVATMFFNMATSSDADFVYNAQVQDDQVKIMQVMTEHNGQLSNKHEYRYMYDEQERLTQKEAYLWNEYKNRWEPEYRLDFAYTGDGYSVERRNWSRKSGAFAEVAERMDYEMVNGSVLAVNIYEYDVRSASFQLKENMLVMNPQQEHLLLATDR